MLAFFADFIVVNVAVSAGKVSFACIGLEFADTAHTLFINNTLVVGKTFHHRVVFFLCSRPCFVNTCFFAFGIVALLHTFVNLIAGKSIDIDTGIRIPTFAFRVADSFVYRLIFFVGRIKFLTRFCFLLFTNLTFIKNTVSALLIRIACII